MAINILGVKPKFTEEQIIRACIENGIQDDEGNVFEVITLVSLRQVAHGSSTLGFTNTTINARNQGQIVIQNGQQGCGRIAWQRKFGRMIGQLAKTKSNIDILAKNYYWKMWKIQEPHIDAEVKALADLYRSKKDEAELAIELSLISGSKASPYGGAVVDREGKTPEDREREIEEAELNKKAAELRNKEIVLNNKENKILEKTVKKIEDGGKVTEFTFEGLTKQYTGVGAQFKLRKLAKDEFGLEFEKTSKRDEIIGRIIEEQINRNVKAIKAQTIVTG
jgi:hypothetical protein